MIRYLRNCAIALDQCGNTFLFGNPDETISSRVGRAAWRGSEIGLLLEVFIDGLFWMLGDGPDHCTRCIEWDEVA